MFFLLSLAVLRYALTKKTKVNNNNFKAANIFAKA